MNVAVYFVAVWGVAALVNAYVRGIPERKSRKRLAAIEEMKSSRSGLRVIQIAHRHKIPESEWHDYWCDAHDRSEGRRPRSEVIRERAEQIAANRRAEQAAPTSAGYNFSINTAELYARPGRFISIDGPPPEPPMNLGPPTTQIPLSDLLSDLQQAGKDRVKHWLSKPAAKNRLELIAADFVAMDPNIYQQQALTQRLNSQYQLINRPINHVTYSNMTGTITTTSIAPTMWSTNTSTLTP